MNQTNSYPCKTGVSEPPHPEVSKRGPQSPQQRAAADQPHSHTRVVTYTHTLAHILLTHAHPLAHPRLPSTLTVMCSHAHTLTHSLNAHTYVCTLTQSSSALPCATYIHTYIHTASHRILLKLKVSLF